jgi:hypothetical protein
MIVGVAKCDSCGRSALAFAVWVPDGSVVAMESVVDMQALIEALGGVPAEWRGFPTREPIVFACASCTLNGIDGCELLGPTVVPGGVVSPDDPVGFRSDLEDHRREFLHLVQHARVAFNKAQG